MRMAMIAAAAVLGLSACGQSGSNSAGPSGGGAANPAAGGAGGCEAFAGKWRGDKGGEMEIARSRDGYTITWSMEMGGERSPDEYLDTACAGGQLQATNRAAIGAITHDAGTDRVTFMGDVYARER